MFREEICGRLVIEQRKVVVIFFGDNSHDWVYAHDTLDFEKYRVEKEKEARKMDETGKDMNLCTDSIPLFCIGNLKRPKMFFRALDDAEMWLTAKTNKKNGRLAVASRAASLAAAENRKPR